MPPSTAALVALLWISPLAIGCGQVSPSAGTSGTGGTGGTGGAMTTEPVFDLTTCGAPTLCPEVESGYGEGFIRPSDASLRCVMQVLHDN